jgi:hypothetical protein
MKKLLWILFPSLLFLVACGRKPATPQDPGPPPTVSSFIMKNLTSEFPGEIRTTNYGGKVQLVLFFRSDDAAFCGSIPEWTALQNEFSSRGFTLIGAVAEEDRRPDDIFTEVSALDISWPVGLADAPIVNAFGGSIAIRAVPTAFLLGRDGLVARSYAGYESIQILRDDINHLLDGQLPPERNSTATDSGNNVS